MNGITKVELIEALSQVMKPINDRLDKVENLTLAMSLPALKTELSKPVETEKVSMRGTRLDDGKVVSIVEDKLNPKYYQVSVKTFDNGTITGQVHKKWIDNRVPVGHRIVGVFNWHMVRDTKAYSEKPTSLLVQLWGNNKSRFFKSL